MFFVDFSFSIMLKRCVWWIFVHKVKQMLVSLFTVVLVNNKFPFVENSSLEKFIFSMCCHSQHEFSQIFPCNGAMPNYCVSCCVICEKICKIVYVLWYSPSLKMIFLTKFFRRVAKGVPILSIKTPRWIWVSPFYSKRPISEEFLLDAARISENAINITRIATTNRTWKNRSTQRQLFSNWKQTTSIIKTFSTCRSTLLF